MEGRQSSGKRFFGFTPEGYNNLSPMVKANFEAVKRMEEQGGLEQYAGKHLFFRDGGIVDSDADEEALKTRVREKYPGPGHFHYVPKPGEKVKTLRPSTRMRFRLQRE